MRIVLFFLAITSSSLAGASDGRFGASSTGSVNISVSVAQRAWQTGISDNRAQLCVAVRQGFVLVDGRTGEIIKQLQPLGSCEFGGAALEMKGLPTSPVRLVIVRAE
ncbi:MULTISPECIES: hypothetical protein [Sphingomonas]|uniref:hypothetical protein n=1 Tax=Sphingomonas TaxID=13687 RepID=UPI000DEEB0BC|nr:MULTISPECIES: hypothetical protein [Sphingomonas]